MKNRKPGLRAFSIVLIIFSLLIVWMIKNKNYYQSLVDSPNMVEKWKADTKALQTDRQAMNQLKANLNKNSDINLEGTKLIVIPGLRGAWSINPKTNAAAFGTNWVPQGLTQSKNNYYVSVYDGNHRLNSLIFQISKQTNKYVKTLILNSKAHVGGITYDTVHERLIYSDDTKQFAGFGYISKEEIDNYCAEKMQKPIHSTHIDWKLGDRTSAISIYKNQLIVAKYARNENGGRSIVSIPLNEKGLFKPITENDVREIELSLGNTTEKNFIKELIKVLEEKNFISSYRDGWNRMQGISLSDSGITVISQSNGNKDSNLLIRYQTPDPKTWAKTSFKETFKGVKKLIVPRAVEEVSINDEETELAMIFESGAKKYRQGLTPLLPSNYMDRIVVLPMSISK